MIDDVTKRKNSQGLSWVLAHVAGVLSSTGFPTGTRAALKRMEPAHALPLTFYAFSLKHLPEGWERNPGDWATIVSAMAIMAPAIYRADTGLGKALARNGYSEARLERLLAAEGDTLRTLFLRAARFLASKQQPFNWTDAGQLFLFRDSKGLERLRLRIARDFYLNQTK